MITRFKNRIGLVVALIISCLATQAQDVAPVEKVANAFTNAELESFNAEEISWLNFVAEDSYQVSYMPGKERDLEDLLARDPEATQTNINPFKAQILPGSEHQYFRIGDTGYVVIFYSESRCQTLLDRKNINQQPH
ncbi:hypothetical protein [Sanyastnella coralliicola]|uniref:hypothetical protein n=1 Tax=Sanyastnella coralliicola TaxID=3069118 RepID=UPI0027BA5C0E|nr:hypothetical protein [Longitalea sp. SCSIO 12813]